MYNAKNCKVVINDYFTVRILAGENGPQFIHVCMQSPSQNCGAQVTRDAQEHTLTTIPISLSLPSHLRQGYNVQRYGEMLNLAVYARDSCHLHYPPVSKLARASYNGYSYRILITHIRIKVYQNFYFLITFNCKYWQLN